MKLCDLNADLTQLAAIMYQQCSFNTANIEETINNEMKLRQYGFQMRQLVKHPHIHQDLSVITSYISNNQQP